MTGSKSAIICSAALRRRGTPPAIFASMRRAKSCSLPVTTSSLISPRTSPTGRSGQSSGAYLASLDKVYPLDVKLVLPGHRSPTSDLRKRVRELRAHHEARLKEALSALDGGGKSAFEVNVADVNCSKERQEMVFA